MRSLTLAVALVLAAPHLILAAPQVAKDSDSVTLSLYVQDGSWIGPKLEGARVTGKDGAGKGFDQTTDTRGFIQVTGSVGIWTFTASKTGYQECTWTQEIRHKTETRYASLKPNPTVTLRVHEGERHGPLLKGARVTGTDAGNQPFDKTTGDDGRVVLTGPPGTWKFAAAKDGYQTNSWDQEITSSGVRDAFILPQPVRLTLSVHDGASNGPVLPGVRVIGADGAGNKFDVVTNEGGQVTLKGAPGTWQFTTSKEGFRTNAWSQKIERTTTGHAFLLGKDIGSNTPPAGSPYTQPHHPKNAFYPDLVGYCTYYAADRWLWDGNPTLPSINAAAKWLNDARDNGLDVGTIPVKGSIVVFGATEKNSKGHVAYVESVGKTTFMISQMNAGRKFDPPNSLKTELFGLVTKDTLKIGQESYFGKVLGFVYPKNR